MEIHAKILDMSAVHDRIVVKNSTLRQEAQAALAAFEAASGLQVCFRPMLQNRWKEADGRFVVGGPYTLHRSLFCQAAKARDLPACMKDDATDLPRLFSAAGAIRTHAPSFAPSPGQVFSLPVLTTRLPRWDGASVTQPVVRACHAGVEEMLIPLWRDGVLTAVVFVGQFLRGEQGQGKPEEQRILTERDTTHLLMMGRVLQSYLLDLLGRLDDLKRDPAVGREAAIDHYIRQHLAVGPTLTGLAQTLSLSSSRTSHVVRQITGRCFQDLVEEKRLALARDLLAASHGKISWVAAQSGFEDAAYFCRYFKRKTGMTPSAWRRLHRQEDNV